MSRVVCIAGAGVGGLAAALSLARQGFDVEVLEQADALGEVGAGIQLGPNCTRVLFDLGLEAALRAVAFVPDGGEMRIWNTGEVLAAAPLGAAVERATGFPYLHVHRADLIGALAAAVAAEPRITLQLGVRVIGFEDAPEGLTILSKRGGVTRATTACALVGADGIHSQVRRRLFGSESPQFTGNVAWRALVPARELPAGLVPPLAVAWWGPGAHFVHYYVRGGELVNCVCVVESRGWEVESWSTPGEPDELVAAFADWHPTVVTLAHAAAPGRLHKWALFDRPPMRTWGRGRVTLLGDACHPTLPFMAQGAAMAIEDGAVLARCLATTPGESRAALARYADLRRHRTAAIQRGSRRNAWIFHMRGLPALARNVYLRFGRPRNPWTDLFEYDALTAHRGADAR